MYKAIIGASIGVFITLLNPVGVNAEIARITGEELLDKLADSAANHVCLAMQQDIDIDSERFDEFVNQGIQDDLEKWVQVHPIALQQIMNLESSRSQIEEKFPELALTKAFKKCPETFARRAMSEE